MASPTAEGWRRRSSWGRRAFGWEPGRTATDDQAIDLIGERPFPADNPDRMLRNRYIDRWRGREAEIPAHRDALKLEVAAAQERGDLAVAGVSAGVSAGLIRSARPAGEIVQSIVREAEALLRGRPPALLG